MQGRTQASRSVAETPYPLGAENATYTGTSTEPSQADWENIFGPAGRDAKLDPQRTKRTQRWHLPDVLKGPNDFIADRIDGLISDATNSPFTTVILPYKYTNNPDGVITWNRFSFDEGMASRVPYESAARVLTQTRRSYSAFVVRNGIGIEMEHNFMASAGGMENFHFQVRQLVGSIQYTNDYDVHMALITTPSYAQEYNEKYNIVEKTPLQICREHIDNFGAIQKNPLALDQIIVNCKAQMKLWEGDDLNFVLCNARLTYNLQMTPDRTDYFTNGPDGPKRQRQGPEISSYNNTKIIYSRAFKPDQHSPARDLLRRRVRVAEFHRVPPQKDRNWEIQLYDEGRDTWFKLTPDDLDRYADLTGAGGQDDSYGAVTIEERIEWADFVRGGGAELDATPFRLRMDVEPDSTEVTMPRLLHPAEDFGWPATLRHILTMNNGIFADTHAKHDYLTISQNCQQAGYFVPTPNQTNLTDIECPIESQHIPYWLFMNAAFLDGTCHFLWTQLLQVDREIVRKRIIPFVYGSNHQQILAHYNAIPDDARMNIYHTVMFLGTSWRWHPDDDVRRMLDKKFSDRRISAHALRAALVRFVNNCLDMETTPNTRIQTGRRLDDVLKAVRYTQADESRAVFNRWPSTQAGGLPIARAAGVAENTGSLDDFRIESKYDQEPNMYPWNTMPFIRAGNDVRVHETTVLDSFLFAAQMRMLRRPDEALRWPEFWPSLKAKGSSEAVEYVIVRPVIEHNMLGVIVGHAGNALGNTFWGQTELSCYDDSMHGIWGMSYKYHSKAVVTENKNLMRCWDIGYDGYNGGKDDRAVDWSAEADGENRPFNKAVSDLDAPYNGPSLMVMKFNVNPGSRSYPRTWPSPIVFHDKLGVDQPEYTVDPEGLQTISDSSWRVFNHPDYREQYRAYLARMPDFTHFHERRSPPGSEESRSVQGALAFEGTMKIVRAGAEQLIYGSGHHGSDYPGVAPLRAGKGLRPVFSAPTPVKMVV